MTKSLKGVSLFSSAGVAEYYLDDVGIHIVAANELLPERAKLYQAQHIDTKMICGDILNENVFQELIDSTPIKLDFLIASPPCQGMSIAGKNRNIEQMLKDDRNYLIFRIIEFINIKDPDFILIENVPTFFKLQLPFNGELKNIESILNELFGHIYTIKAKVYNACDYGVAQRRLRAIIKLHKHGAKWEEPKTQNKVTVQEAIGHLPSIEAGEISDLRWHSARKHSENHILWMKNTPTGKTAFDNIVHFPVKKNGERICSYNTTYHRMQWNEPAPTITIRNDAISSQLNVHPGKLKSDGTYSDARVLTLLELMILTSLPENWNIPHNTPELLIRKCIGESIPPLLIKQIVSKIER